MYCQDCGNLDCNLMNYEILKHFKGEKIMGYWTKYKCTFCGEILIGDEENIEHTREHRKGLR